MSTKRISLHFRKFDNPDLVDLDIGIIRLFCEAAFVSKEGYTDSYSAILDTGAPVSVIPYQIWSMVEVNEIRDYAIRGVVPKRECSLPVTIGEISCILLDAVLRLRISFRIKDFIQEGISELEFGYK